MAYARLLALTIYIVVGTSVGCSHTSDARGTETARFRSGTYTDLRQILTREAPTSTIKIPATLAFPDAANNRHPGVVIVCEDYGRTLSHRGEAISRRTSRVDRVDVDAELRARSTADALAFLRRQLMP